MLFEKTNNTQNAKAVYKSLYLTNAFTILKYPLILPTVPRYVKSVEMIVLTHFQVIKKQHMSVECPGLEGTEVLGW